MKKKHKACPFCGNSLMEYKLFVDYDPYSDELPYAEAYLECCFCNAKSKSFPYFGDQKNINYDDEAFVLAANAWDNRFSFQKINYYYFPVDFSNEDCFKILKKIHILSSESSFSEDMDYKVLPDCSIDLAKKLLKEYGGIGWRRINSENPYDVEPIIISDYAE